MKLTLEKHGSQIREMLGGGWSYRGIAFTLGCDHTTVAKFVKQNYPELISMAPNGHASSNTNNQYSGSLTTGPLGADSRAVDPIELLKAENAELRKAAKTRRQEQVIGERMLEEIRGITPPTAPRYEAPQWAEGSGKLHTHVLLLSDLHVGEVVDKEAMNGLGEYNFEILKQRMANIHSALISFQNSVSYPIEELRIWQLGDMTGGQHHEELAQTNEFGLAEQSWNTGMLIGQFIEGLVPDYLRIHSTGISGNHSRMNAKPQAKQVFNSFDWLASKTAGLYLANYPSVTHNYPMSGYVLDKVAGKTVLLGHGDGIQSTMPGVPWGGVTRRFNELFKTYQRIGETLDYFALGHFHQANAVKGIFMNGSVKGPDEWVLKKFGTADPPEQLLLTFCNDTQRLTGVNYINP